jgi:phosphopantetheinyl transferase
MHRLFTAEERVYVEQCNTESAFFDIWCAKEAFVKWMGEGFARPLSSVSVDVAGRCAVSDAIVCDLAWYTIGQSRICCAADDLSSGIEIRVVSPNEFTKYQEE